MGCALKPPGARAPKPVDALVIGAGFGGLGAALTLAEAGRNVVVCEALNYPGGCASTFERGGASYESGATLFAGFGPGQLFTRWIEEHSMQVPLEAHDPIVTLRTSAGALAIGVDREAFVERVCKASAADPSALRAFFAYQERIADILWSLFDQPDLLPPFDLQTLIAHIPRVPRYLPLLRLIGRPLRAVMRRFGLDEDPVLRDYLNAVCQITVQASVDQAEAPFALAAMDYYFRGCRHVTGGIGVLAHEMAGAIERAGGEVNLTTRVRSIARHPEGYLVTTRRGAFLARAVFANVLPQGLEVLCDDSIHLSRSVQRLAARVSEGWGAAMLYLQVASDAVEHPHAHHLELVADRDAPFTEGNHIFVSLSGCNEEERAGSGRRTATVSTHVPASLLVGMNDHEQRAYIEEVQLRMRNTLALRAPELTRGIHEEMTASPRTWQRFTRREAGFVGGIPRRAGLQNYRQVGAFEAAAGLYLVGDSVFPGQSTLATALGGRIAACDALHGALRRSSLMLTAGSSGALTSS